MQFFLCPFAWHPIGWYLWIIYYLIYLMSFVMKYVEHAYHLCLLSRAYRYL